MVIPKKGRIVAVRDIEPGVYYSKFTRCKCNFIDSMKKFHGERIEVEKVLDDRIYSNGYYWLFEWLIYGGGNLA